MTLGEMLKGSGIPTISKLEILPRADRVLPHGRYYGGQIDDQDWFETLLDGVEMSEEARGRIEWRTPDEVRADDEYFRTGARYPGQ